MNEQYTNQEKETIDALQSLNAIPEREQAQIERGKAAFLAEAKRIQNQPVSISPFRRLIYSLTQPQPKLRLSTLTISIIFTAMLLVSFTGSVYAAQQALPNQALYPYKLWLEDTRILFTPNAASKINLHLNYAEERLNEYNALGIDPTNPLSGEIADEFNAHADEASSLLQSTASNAEQETRLHDLQAQLDKLLGSEEPEDQAEDVESSEDEDQADDDKNDDLETEVQTPRPTSKPESSEEPENGRETEDSENAEDHEDREDSSEPEDTEKPKETESPEDTDEPNEPENSDSEDSGGSESPEEPDEPDDEPEEEEEDDDSEEAPED